MRKPKAALVCAGTAMVFALAVLMLPSLASGETAAEPDGQLSASLASQSGSAPGSSQAEGVSMQPESGAAQDLSPGSGGTVAPPVGLTERGERALREARSGNAVAADRQLLETTPVPAAEDGTDTPALGTSFLGVADTGSFPPDPVMAAGLNNVVVSTNGAVNILDKRGNSLSSQTLTGFFSALGTEHSDVFDPWLAYDPYINRFWIIAASGRTTAHSDVVVGLSNTSDATLGWTLWELDSTVNGATDTQNWCDYPKIGFDAQAIYITCNMFRLNTTTNANEFQHSKLRVMTKDQFVNNTGIFWWDFWDLLEGNTGSTRLFTLQPAQMFGATAANGEFLVNARGGGGTGNTLDVWRVTNAAECCNNDATGPTLTDQGHGVGSYGPSDGARQSGSTVQINNGDSRLLYAIWRNGRLSTGHTVACSSSSTDACGGFTELNVASYPTITTLNNWALTAGGQDVYFPSVASNSSDDKTMVFSVSDQTTFASAAYVGIPSSADCTGCLDGGTTLLRSGGNTYVRTDGRGRNRWGDYSGASPDPNGQGVWVAGEFAASTANTWGVQVGLTYQPTPPPANDNFARLQTISGSTPSVSSSSSFATREPNEPDHLPSSSSPGEKTVWYSWTAPASGVMSFNTCTSNFDTALGVYTGSFLGSLSRVTNDDDSCTSPNGSGSQLSFNAVAGTTYRIAVGGFSSASEGTFTLSGNLVVPPSNDNFANAQSISGSFTSVNGTTRAATRESGEPDHYTPVPGDSDWVGDHSVWYSWTSPFTGPVEMETCTANIDSILAVYRGSSLASLVRVRDNNNGCASGFGSKLTFNATSGTTYRIAVGDAGGAKENTFTLRLAERTPPTVVATNPVDGATGVSRTANITARFSENMRPGTISTTTFRLVQAGTTTTIPATVTYNATTRVAVLNPSSPLAPGTRYVASVNTGVRDLATNRLQQTEVWRFTTGS